MFPSVQCKPEELCLGTHCLEIGAAEGAASPVRAGKYSMEGASAPKEGQMPSVSLYYP